MVELDSSLVAKAIQGIEKNMERVAKKKFNDDKLKVAAFVKEGMGRIVGSIDMIETVKHTDLVIEAIVENLAAKQKLFSTIDRVSEKQQIGDSL